MSIPARLIALCLVTCLPASSRAEPPRPSSAREKLVPVGISRALIIAGLPGDDAHEEQFAAIVKEWRTWLTDSLGFSAAEVRVLFGKAGEQRSTKATPGNAADRENVLSEARALILKPGEDRRGMMSGVQPTS